MFLRGTSSPLASGVVKKALPNGDQYEGQWQEDSGPHGKGKMIYSPSRICRAFPVVDVQR